MSDHRRGEDRLLESLGRHLLIGGMLGLGVGACWEVMSWLWTAGQFAPLRRLQVATSLGILCGLATGLMRVPRKGRQGAIADTQCQLGVTTAAYDGAALPSRGNSSMFFWEHVAWGIIGGEMIAPAYGTATWTSGPGHVLFTVVGCSTLGVAMGVLVWSVRVKAGDWRAYRAPHAADPIGTVRHTGCPPAAFEHRLATFLHCTAEEMLRSQPRPQSKMPFWSIVDFRSYVGPKPVWIIRRILERIRATVRGRGQRRGNSRC